MAGGRIVAAGTQPDLLVDPKLRAAFLGAASKEKPEASRLGAAGLTNIRLEKPDMHQHTFMPDFPDHSALAAHQLKGLQWTVRHAFEGSSFYRQRLEKAGVAPNAIHSLDDLKRLPFTTADDLREFYPFPLRSVPFEQIVRIHASSGTTGKRKIIGYTQKDLDDWVHFFARCYEMAGVTPLDRVQIAVGYGIWTAGMGFQLGCEKVGAMAVPVGPGNIDMHSSSCRMCARRSFAARPPWPCFMAEEIHRRGIADKISIRKIIYGSERSSRSMRPRFRAVRRCRAVRHHRPYRTIRPRHRHRVRRP
jgi:phenylacetate-CoA ligase